jgi:N-methylhydantoinase A/oxoprolinase/acetone carboxylase beta subunit
MKIALMIELATLEALHDKRAYTVVGFEPDGGLVACVDGPNGRFWMEL